MTDRRNDAGLASPMVDDIVRRYGKAPERLLLDTHYATVEDIAASWRCGMPSPTTS